MDARANARNTVLRKIVITTITGAVSFPFTQLLYSALPAQITMAAAVGSIVLLVQFLIDFERRLGRVEQQLITCVDDVRQAVDEGFAKVSSATQLLASVENGGLQAATVTGLVRNAGQITKETDPLVRVLAESEIDRVSEFLRELNGQGAKHDGEDQDWLLGLTRCAMHSIDAISLPEVDAAGNSSHSFWLHSPLGRRYLIQQWKATQRGVRVRRVFLAKRDKLAQDPVLQSICRTQAELDIEVRVLYPSAVPRKLKGSLVDFIVFDDALSYEVTPEPYVKDGDAPMIMHTWLHLRRDHVEERIEMYNDIWALAEPLADIPLLPDEPPSQLLEEGRH